jgi:membrane fusion protein (multidrug efflux system)
MSWVKRLTRIAVFWLGPVLVAVGGGWLYLQGGRYISTDNAYLKSDMVDISSELTGKVAEVFVADYDRVTAGQVLFRLDDDVYEIALARAEANILKVRSDLESLRADYLNKVGDVQNAEADLHYYVQERERLRKLAKSGSISEVQVAEAVYDAEHAQKQLEITQQALEVVKAKLIDPDLPVEHHPDYKLALAEREKAVLDLEHVEVKAPVAGILARFEVKPGEVVAGGFPLFSIVDNSHMWVEANYKETDLTFMRTGQTAVIKVDAYPDLEWKGVVANITPGTGSEFSLLPAQNSSGNWVKVVQRIAVKLDMQELASAPELTAGMSANVSVDTKHQRHLPWL